VPFLPEFQISEMQIRGIIQQFHEYKENQNHHRLGAVQPPHKGTTLGAAAAAGAEAALVSASRRMASA
jgi:hypothetical protein